MRISDWSSDVCSSDLLNISRTGKRGIVLDSTRIGQIVRDERKELGLRQDELAAASGVGLRFIVDLERGKATAQIGKVITVLAALGCELQIRRPDGIVIAGRDRKSVVEGKRVSVRVDAGGRRIIK